jgi:hypothetical protein
MSRLSEQVASTKATFGGVELELVYLDDGQAVIRSEGMEALIAKMQDGSLSAEDAQAAAKWARKATAQ